MSVQLAKEQFVFEGGSTRIISISIELLVDGILVSPDTNNPGSWISKEGFIFGPDHPLSKVAVNLVSERIQPVTKPVRPTWDHGDSL